MVSKALEVEGLRELNRALKRLGGRAAKNAARAGTRAGAAVIGKQARENAPRATGALRRGIKWQASRRRSSDTRIVFVVGPTEDVFYGSFIEFGTSKRPARPWLRPALDDKGAEAVRVLRAKTWERLRKEAAKRR